MIITIDFETLPISKRPDYPPVPVGVAIKIGAKRSKYYGWAHPTGGNNSTFIEAQSALRDAYESGAQLLFHNSRFDIDVAEAHLGMPRLPWDRYHDTMPLLFLHDPRAKSYGLKQSAEAIFEQAPEERDEVIEWLIKHQPIPNKRLSDASKGKNYAGAYIAFAPCDLVGRYACGDVDRTYKIFKHLYKAIKAWGMLDAYNRELRLNPHLLAMERSGMRIDHARLRKDVDAYTALQGKIDAWLIKRLKAPKDINLDSSKELVAALLKAKVATLKGLGQTPTGQVRTSKDALEDGVSDPQVLAVMRYRSALGTCLRTFMRPWLATAEASGGYIYCQWHSTRSDNYGTKTGRLSSTPNFQNIPKNFAEFFADVEDPIGLMPLPHVRGYIIPYVKDDVILGRDYSQQEPRILGHFENSVLIRAYGKNPWLDLHEYAKGLINDATGMGIERHASKQVGLGIIYGLGIGRMAENLNISVDQAKKIKDAYLDRLPGIRTLSKEMRSRARDNQPIRTWGGRLYYCEDPKVINGVQRTFEYRLLNILIQGSAADCTKEALIRFMDKAPKKWRVLATIHDEIAVSVPKADRDRAMALLTQCMESVEFDIPMLSEGSWSAKSFDKASLKTYDEKGKSRYGYKKTSKGRAVRN